MNGKTITLRGSLKNEKGGKKEMDRLERVTTKRKGRIMGNRHTAVLAFTGIGLMTSGLLYGQEPSLPANSGAAEVATTDMGFVSTLINLPQHSLILIAVALLGSVLLSHSVLTSGKNGWGWVTLCFAVAMMAVVVKVGVSMFCEMSAPNEISDWDEG